MERKSPEVTGKAFRGPAKTKKTQKMHLQGSDGTNTNGGWLDSVKRGWTWKCVAGKCSTRPHAPAREIQAAGEETRVVGAWLRFSLRCFEKTWRSPCAPDGMVGVGKGLRRKSRRRWGFSDDDTIDRKALGDGKGDRNETWPLKDFPEWIHG